MSSHAAVPACVAAAHPATAQAGAQILAAGGSAADAAVASLLTSCVAETVMTGLGGGGFATYWDSEQGRATCLDFFVTVPGVGLDRPVTPMREIDVSFGIQRLEYHVGPATVAVPGVLAGVGELHRRWCRLPWRDLVQPALELARTGVAIQAEQVHVLADVQAAMLNGDGDAIYAPGGQLLRPGDRLYHPGLSDALELVRDEGPTTMYTGGIGRSLISVMAERGGAITPKDLAAYAVMASEPATARLGGYDIYARRDLLGLLATISRLPADIDKLEVEGRYLAMVDALRNVPDLLPGTSSLVAVDSRGNACAASTSLGLGSGDWLPGLGIHGNSMLGEGELMGGDQRPGERVPSMMVPLVAVDGDGLAFAAAAAGGSRIRSALLQVLVGALAEGISPQQAVDRARVNPVSTFVHAEPGVPDSAIAGLVAAGHPIEHWARRAPYFGGVTAVGRGGGAADPRRGGAVAFPDGRVLRRSLDA